MDQNTRLRQGVVAHLLATLPPNSFETLLDDWQIIDGESDTPALMVYLDEGELDTQYMDATERYSGSLSISIYLGPNSTDALVDEKGELVRVALPIGTVLPGVAALYRQGFQYERSETGAYRALHMTHVYRLE